MQRYEYRLHPANDVIELLLVRSKQPDSYLSDDHASRAISESLASGFRWIRTEYEVAIFERLVSCA